VVYDIVVDRNEYIGPQTVATLGRNITVYIRSTSPVSASIQLESQGHLFSVDTNITLILQDIVLKGISTNNSALVLVGQGGKLILNSGAKITLNTNISSGRGGGVFVRGGVLELNEGCEIVGNKISTRGGHGGGINVDSSGSVILHGGIISENRNEGSISGGGGIFIEGNSSVSMMGGVISKNYSLDFGGGIYVDSGSSFTKRAASGSSVSGIIYGSAGDNANRGYNGHAIRRNFGSLRNRNSTLGYYDEISTLSDVGWE
jgi:hypothetical protein